MLAREPGECGDLVDGVDGAVLGGLGDGNGGGLELCTTPMLVRRDSTSSGVSLPSVVGTVSSLLPARRSYAPHSSTLRWATSEQMTA